MPKQMVSVANMRKHLKELRNVVAGDTDGYAKGYRRALEDVAIKIKDELYEKIRDELYENAEVTTKR